MAAKYHFDYMDAFHEKAYRQMAGRDYFCPERPKALTVEGGIVLPYRKLPGEKAAAGGVLDARMNYVRESAQHIVGEEMAGGYVPETVEESDRQAIYFGPFHAHWGHFLTEMVTRCWYLCREIDWSAWYVVYVRKADTCETGMGGTYLEFLELLGVPADRVIEVERPTRFLRVVVPEVSNDPGRSYTAAFVELFDRVRDSVRLEGPASEKVYFTRMEDKGLRSTQIGEKKIRRFFEKNGYRVAAPERLSLKEQIHLIRHCEELVVIEGTLPHNILFARPGIRLTVINRVCGTNFYQPFINQAREAEVTYVDAHLSFFPVFAGGPFLLYLSEELLRYGRDRQMALPKRREGGFSLHAKLVWYFFCYLDQMTSGCIRRWRLEETYGDRVLGQYAFYREKLKGYEGGLWPKFRKGLYLVIKGIVD